MSLEKLTLSDIVLHKQKEFKKKVLFFSWRESHTVIGCPMNSKHMTKRAVDQTTLTISLPKALKKAIRDAAADDKRTVSNYLAVELARLLAATKPSKNRSQ